MPPDTNTGDSTQPLENAINANTGSADTGVPSSDVTPVEDEGGQTGTSTPSTQAEGAEGAKTDTAETKKTTPWFQRRIDQLTAEKWEERRAVDNLRKQTAELLAQLAEARKPQATPVDTSTTSPTTTPAPTPVARVAPQQLSDAEINAMAEKRAEEISRQRTFNKACNDIADRGKEEFGDFDQKLRTFQMLGGIPTPLLETITEMPNAHKILYNLGSDPDLAERVVKMPPVKQALELARLENSLSKPVSKQVSSAPAPVQPIDTGSRATDDPERMSMEDFVKWREKQTSGKRR